MGEANTGFVGDSTTSITEEKGEEGGVNLKREMGLFSGISLIIGTIVGAGIWTTPGSLMENSGSVGMFLMQYFLCGSICTLGAICYIELACVVPKSGGETVYIKAGLGDGLSFLYSWLRGLVLGPASGAYLALAGGQNLLLITPSILSEEVLDPVTNITSTCTMPEQSWERVRSGQLLAAVALFILSAVNMWSVKWAARVQNIFTVAKLGGIAILIVGGIVNLCQGKFQNFKTGFDQLDQLPTPTPSSIGMLFFSGGFAFDGWNQLNYITEEIKEPMKNLPRAIFIGMPMIVILYVLIAISYLTVLDPIAIQQSSTVASEWSQMMLGVMAWTIPLCVSLSCFGSLNGTIFTAGRITYSASREGHFPSIISFVNYSRNTPLPAILLNLLVTMVFIFIGDSIDPLLNMYMTLVLLYYGLALASLVVMRWTKPKADRPFKVWLPIPLLLIVFFWGCLVVPFLNQPMESSAVRMYTDNLIWLSPGLLGYCLNLLRRRYLAQTHFINRFVDSIMFKITVTLQKAFGAILPEHED